MKSCNQERRVGVLAKKLGMSSLFLPDGICVPVTVLHLPECCVVSQKTPDKHGYTAIQVGAGLTKKMGRPLTQFFSKIEIDPREKLCEFRVGEKGLLPVGFVLRPSHFPVGGFVDVVGQTIGRGFAGAMKRHGFGGLRASHGVSVSHRSHGSTGHRKSPARVFKGKKMAGRMGGCRVSIQNLQVLQVDDERGFLVIKGAVPGYEGGWLQVRDAVKCVLTENHAFPSVGA